jgi:hypothetical protein
MSTSMRATMNTDGANETQLRAWLTPDPWRLACLEAMAALDLFDGWIGAGFVRSLVWDRLHGFPGPTPLADVDVLFFEPGSGRDRENEVAAALADRLPEVPWSVKNQARMHVRNGAGWRPRRPWPCASQPAARWKSWRPSALTTSSRLPYVPRPTPGPAGTG